MITNLPIVAPGTLCECGDNAISPGVFMVQHLVSEHTGKAVVHIDPVCEDCTKVVDADEAYDVFVLRSSPPVRGIARVVVTTVA